MVQAPPDARSQRRTLPSSLREDCRCGWFPPVSYTHLDVYKRQISTFAEMNAVWDKWVVAGATPGRATVEAKLAAPQFTVEIAVIAAK